MQIFRGNSPDGGIVGHDLIAPTRRETVGHQPDRRQTVKLCFDGLAGLFAMEKKPANALLADSPGQFIGIGDKTDEEVEIIFPGRDGNASQQDE